MLSSAEAKFTRVAEEHSQIVIESLYIGMLEQVQVEPLNKLIRMFVEPILDEIFPNETGAARLQQVGLFTLIFMLQGDEKPITATRLAAMTGQTETQIGNQLRKLTKLKLVERKKILNKQGRGHALHLMVRHNAKTRRLAEAINKAGKDRGP